MSEQNVQQKTLTELREAKNLTREELAVQLKTPYSTIVNIETGRSKPRVELAEKIYAFFKMPVGSIRWGKPESESTPKIEATAVA